MSAFAPIADASVTSALSRKRTLPSFVSFDILGARHQKEVMVRFLQVILAIVLLAGCQKQTGYRAVDELVVKNYEDRMKLSLAFEYGRNYCSYGAGCSSLCSMVPEPKNHIVQAIELTDDFDALKKHAEARDLILELPKVRPPVLSIVALPQITDEAEISRVQLKCLQDQQQHLNKIERILEKIED